jgi:hypothetical protein
VCTDNGFSFTKTKLGPTTANCGGVGKKPAISCAAGSGSGGYCDGAVSNGAAFYIMVLPNNNGGTFRDSDGTVYNTCDQVWAAYGASAPPSNVTGIFFSDGTTADQLVSCNGTACTANTVSCFANWDNVALKGLSTPVVFTLGAPGYLACAYIDYAGGAGPPPVAGQVATSSATAFFPFIAGAGSTISFSTWTDY